MVIGITCFATPGGSGVIASELGQSLAERGHEVHFVCPELPFRLEELPERASFHLVRTVTYPVFTDAPYTLALASKMSEVACEQKLDLFHVHYALPHAVAGYLARQICRHPFRLITTVHGTDARLVGLDPSYRSITRFSLQQSDGVSAVSHDLAASTQRDFELDREVAVIHNFVDTERFGRRPMPAIYRRRFAADDEKIIVHVSNFRPVKRVSDCIRALARIRESVPAKLVMVGDGPEREPAEHLSHDLGIGERVFFLGTQTELVSLLSIADLFILPSELESFGLAALEAMSCEVPVIAYGIGGLPELVVDGETGYLAPFAELEALAERAVRILTDAELANRMAMLGRARAVERFGRDQIVSRYEEYYQQVLDGC